MMKDLIETNFISSMLINHLAETPGETAQNGSQNRFLSALLGPSSDREISPEKEGPTLKSRVANARLEALLRQTLRELGEDPNREGLLETPQRVRRSLAFLTDGYEKDYHEVLGNAVFEEDYDEVVLVRDIEMYSLCEHH